MKTTDKRERAEKEAKPVKTSEPNHNREPVKDERAEICVETESSERA